MIRTRIHPDGVMLTRPAAEHDGCTPGPRHVRNEDDDEQLHLSASV
jgi:hypothetical protein